MAAVGVETMNHLASKAMLADWARKIAPEARAEEEVTLKDEATQFHRRPDVLVLWAAPEEQQLALEVEYKAFSYEAWRAKQDAFSAQRIACTWLLGHTSIKATRAKSGRWDRAVLVPKQADIIAATGRHVLVVNPNTQQIGTLSGDPKFTTKVGPNKVRAWLALDDLIDCQLTVEGIITPATRRIDQAIRAREEALARKRAEEAEKKRLAEEAERQRLAELARLEAERLRKEESERVRRERMEKRWAEWNARWLVDPLKATVDQRWESLPKVIGDFGENPGGIHAAPAHWHAVLYEGLIHSTKPGTLFTLNDCWSLLRESRIETSRISEQRLESLRLFLETLAGSDLIGPDVDGWKVHRGFITQHDRQAREQRHKIQTKNEPTESQLVAVQALSVAPNEAENGLDTGASAQASQMIPVETPERPRGQFPTEAAHPVSDDAENVPVDVQESPDPPAARSSTAQASKIISDARQVAVPYRFTPRPASPEQASPPRPKKRGLLKKLAGWFVGK